MNSADIIHLIAAFIVSFLIVVLCGRRAIAWLAHVNAVQTVSGDAPAGHASKQGTPTMGGLLIMAALTITVVGIALPLEWQQHRHNGGGMTVIPLLAITLAFGAIGFLDDFLSARRGKNLGLRARDKFAAQCVAATGFVIWLAASAQPGLTTSVVVGPPTIANLSGTPGLVIDLKWMYFPLAGLLMVAFSNASNFTDGLDGLAGGIGAIASLVLAALAYVMYPAVGLFAIAMAGAFAGFLWWNASPAQVFMGDTGSLALGAGLVGAALISKQEAAMLVATLVCWAELFSVIAQVLVFKARRMRRGLQYASSHRLLRRAPLHHHFEELGWPETRVVSRFWLVTGICSGLALLWLRQ